MESCRRKFRTRPSEVCPGIIIDANGAAMDFYSTLRNSVYEDPSYGNSAEELSDWTASRTCIKRTNKAPKIKKSTKKKRKPQQPKFSAAEFTKFNALFEDVNEYSLIIEKVEQDGYVRRDSSDSNENYGLGVINDSSVWTCDEVNGVNTTFLSNSDDARIFSPTIRGTGELPPNISLLSISNVEERNESVHLLPRRGSSLPSSSKLYTPISATKCNETKHAPLSLGRRNISQLPANNPLKRFYYLHDFNEEPTDLNFLLHACEQRRVMSWDDLSSLKGTRKLGEGAYGEVFKTKVNDVPVALKVIPFVDVKCTYNGLVNGEHMKHTMEILPELLITKELSELADVDGKLASGFLTPSFVRLVQTSVVKGCYPDELLTEWDRYARITKKSENDRPDTYASEDQLFIAFALSLGGKDLESYTIKNEREAWSIFFQIALSLAVAEETMEFEHRDLHWGNVLIDNCKAATSVRYIFNNETIVLKSCGVSVSIIDFTNSRMQRDGTIIYPDLSKDEELFKGEGDYQFEIYRMMREKNNDNWQQFTPFTNNLWLHYIATKVFAAKKITAKRRKEAMAVLDGVLKVERIKRFLEDETVVEIFKEYAVNENGVNVI